MYAAVDIGGTKTLIATFTPEGTVVEQLKFPTPNNFKDFLLELEENVEKLSTKSFIAGAVGMPGSLDRAAGVSKSAGGNLTWKNTPIVAELSKIFNCPFTAENDANTAGLGEAVLVKDAYRKVLYITISTGIGGVYVLDGSIDQNTIDAEIGHMIIKSGSGYKTWEKLSSGKTLVETYGKRASEIDDDAIWEKFTENIAVGIINVCASLTPDLIIIGGGAGANLSKFKAPLLSWIERIAPAAIQVPPIIVASRPEEAVIYGCYELAKRLS